MSSRSGVLPDRRWSPIGCPMTSRKDRSEGKTAGGERAERLRAALRENLKRRKAQARGRGESGVQSHDSAGIEPEIAGQPPKG